LAEVSAGGEADASAKANAQKARALDYLRLTLVTGAKRRGASGAQDRALLKRLDEVLARYAGDHGKLF